MNGSVLTVYKVGVGPSSSHTMGPMKAACVVRRDLTNAQTPAHLQVELFGSLALTGRGHATDTAVIYGLLGFEPETIDIDAAQERLADLREHGRLTVGSRDVVFRPECDILWSGEQSLPRHPNGMRFHLVATDGTKVSRTFYSIGGGTVIEEGKRAGQAAPAEALPYLYDSMSDAVRVADASELTLAQMAYLNECVASSSREVDQYLDTIWREMDRCIANGLAASGVLPGGLGVRRRAKRLHERLEALKLDGTLQNKSECASVYAIAVNEENAAGRRVVTAPTNGAAGVVPAVLRYFCDGRPAASTREIREFLLTAAVVGDVVRRRASISGAEVGCQGEVGTASAMAAAGLAAVSGADNKQIEVAAEIALEHHLGMSCDPVQGLVQVPCIERNSMGAIKAIHACSLALNGSGDNVVSFDEVVEAMRETGHDMSDRYKETALGGLATKVIRVHRAKQ